MDNEAYKKRLRRLGKLLLLHQFIALFLLVLPSFIWSDSLLAFLGLPALFIWVWVFGDNTAKKIFSLKREQVSTWHTVTGKLTKVVFSVKEREFSYEYNGNIYKSKTNRGINADGAIEGEYYLLKVNPSEPNEYWPLDWQPLFLEGEEFATTDTTKVKPIKPWFFSKDRFFNTRQVFFTYIVNGKHYERRQVLPPAYENEYGEIGPTRKYTVKYSSQYPQRAILILS